MEGSAWAGIDFIAADEPVPGGGHFDGDRGDFPFFSQEGDGEAGQGSGQLAGGRCRKWAADLEGEVGHGGLRERGGAMGYSGKGAL